MNRSPSITLIISAHRQAAPLRFILERLAGARVRPAQIIVAEDGEDSETERVVREAAHHFSPAPLHLRQPHTFFRKSFVLNRAIAAATAEYVVFLDGDCVPHRDFIADHASLARAGAFVQGRRAFIREARVPAFLAQRSGLVRLALSGGLHGTAKGVHLPLPLVRTDRDFHGVLGCNLGVWRSDLELVNGFDEAFEGWGHEDADLAARLYANGRVRRVVHGRAIVYHLDHPTAPRDRAKSNRARFEAGVASGRLRCDCGLKRFSSAP